MDKKNETLNLTREQFYSANSDFASARKVNNGQEVVDYFSGPLARRKQAFDEAMFLIFAVVFIIVTIGVSDSWLP